METLDQVKKVLKTSRKQGPPVLWFNVSTEVWFYRPFLLLQLALPLLSGFDMSHLLDDAARMREACFLLLIFGCVCCDCRSSPPRSPTKQPSPAAAAARPFAASAAHHVSTVLLTIAYWTLCCGKEMGICFKVAQS